MLSDNPTQMDNYNKHANKEGPGTLMANWFEERVHRQDKGEGRAITRTHFPRHNATLHEGTLTGFKRAEDDTKYRIHGNVNQPITRTENYHYGKGVNKAQQIPKVGRKQQLIQQMYLKTVTQQMNQLKQKQEEQARKGQFDTEYRTTFHKKPLDANQVGRLVMRDQDGRLVDIERVDEDLRQSNKFIERGQITSDEQLKKLIDTDIGYQRQEPVTFWREKLDDGTYYMSKPSASNQVFGKNNDFLKTFKHYKHYHD